MPTTPGLTVAADSGRNDVFGRMRTSVPLSVVVTSLGTAATVLAAMSWQEVY